MTEQSSLFADDKDVSVDPADIARIARQIAESAPDDPYAEQAAREAAIIDLRDDDIGGQQTGFRYRSADGDRVTYTQMPPSTQSPTEDLTSPQEARAHIAAIRAQLRQKRT